MRGGFDFSRSKVFITGLIIVLLAFMLSPPFTGWITDVLRMDIGIGSEDSICLYFIEVPVTTVIQDSDVNFEIEASNCGSTSLDGRLVLDIVDSVNLTVDSINSNNYSLNPSQYYILNTTWTASPPLGFYTLVVGDLNYNGNNTNIQNWTFEIGCSPGSFRCFGNERWICSGGTSWSYFTTCGYLCSGGACISEPGGPSEPGVIPGGGGLFSRIGLEYNEYIEIAQDSEQTVLIKVINDGTSVLSNITLDLTSDGVAAVNSDIWIERLSPNSSAFFVFDVNTEGSSIGNQTVDFLVKSGSATASGRIIIGVVAPFDERDSCENMISYYLDMLDTMNQEVKSMELRGINVSLIREMISEAAEEIEDAKSYSRLGVYSNCINLSGSIREKIERIAEIIVTTVEEEDVRKPVVAQPGLPIWIIWIIVIILLIVVVIAGARLIRDYMRKHKLVSITHRW